MKAFAILSWALFALLASSSVSAAIVEHTFTIRNLSISRFCHKQVVAAVNGKVPGPTIRARENDTLVVHVFNASPHNITIHWHGIFQIRSQWADGPVYVTQCPLRPGQNYTHIFKIIKQEGTLWWHAHASFLRTYAYGAIIIRPRQGLPYPFPKPNKEVTILLGEWWKDDIIEIENQIQVSGDFVPPSDGFTINGLPGDLYNCSQGTYKLKVKQGKTYMLRIVNANLISQMFFKVANHNLVVVAVNAGYTTPYVTDVIVVAPGQTTDVLLRADQPLGSYYMAASAYVTSAPTIGYDNTTTTAIVVYEGTNSTSLLMPIMPAFNDTQTAHRFFTNLTGLIGGPHWANCPNTVDEQMLITIGLNLDFCANNGTCAGAKGYRYSASMNNESFVNPSDKGSSMLEAFYYGVSGVYTRDFPNNPPMVFDYTNENFTLDLSKIFAPKSTKVKTLKFNSTVEIVFQDTTFLGLENHPMHIHGYNFYILAQGFGNYNAATDRSKFNLVNPQMRNTIAVPRGGWAVIRFRANNPGVWLVHCHVDSHLVWGLGMVFEIENGPTPSTSVPPPPLDLPKC